MVSPLLRRAIVRHLGLILVTGVLLTGLVTFGVRLIAHTEAERTAERVSRQIAAAVLVPLAERDWGRPVVRSEVLADLSPFLDSGMVRRVKVWVVEGERVRIAFSDEQRIEAASRAFDPDLARRLDAGEAVVLDVPQDAEHRYESAAELREVFIGFTDESGSPARLEVYVPVDVGGTIRSANGVLVPLAVGGVLVVGVAMLPLSVALVRRLDRYRAERGEALQYGLAAAELARREIARRLHDDVVPDLAAAGAALDLVAARPDSGRVSDAREAITRNQSRMRALLDGLVPPEEATGDDLPAAFAGLLDAVSSPPVELLVDGPVRPGAAAAVVLHRVGAELLRNAVAHAGAGRITVRLGSSGGRTVLRVDDDGRGFDPTAPSPGGHVGLRLVRRAVADAGGRTQIRSTPGAGTTVTVSL